VLPTLHQRECDGPRGGPGRFLTVALLVGAVLLLCAAASPAQAQWLNLQRDMMGTDLRIYLWDDDPDAGQAAIEAVVADMSHINALMSPYRADSELSRMNARAAQAPVHASAELIEVLEQARAVSELTGGAFDITYASVGHLYDYRRHIKPSETAIGERLPAIDYHHVKVDKAAGTVSFTRPGVRIDLGGIAKGYAVERAAGILRDHGVRHAQISLGGDTRLLGDHRGRPWIIGIQDPRDAKALAVRLPLSDTAVSTSGDYERYFVADGIRYHHIIDPATGRSPHAVESVSILGPDATRTDALSTSVFVMGIQQGLALIDELPGFEAIVVDSRGRLHYSEGLARAGAHGNGKRETVRGNAGAK